ncbi:MAG: hypothetical protein K2L46_07915 [Paramuribaculum sp.]|nr:hypothetical protein [Paramuribaculum sp.]MDE6489190.1 hypothetical protein [Paramuribaculum sp.]
MKPAQKKTKHNCPQVYTLAGNQAATINVTPRAEGTEIGLVSGDKAEDVTLRFDNTSCVEGLSLVDRKTGYVEPLYDGLEYTVEAGDLSGRLFITSRNEELPSDGQFVAIKVTGDGVSAMTVENGHIDLTVYDLTGKCVAKAGGDDGFAEINGLANGFYIAEAVSDNGSRSLEKVQIR